MAQAGFDTAATAPHLNQNEQDLLLSALKSNQKDRSAEGTLNPDATQFNPAGDANFIDGLDDPSLFDGQFDGGNFNWDLDPSSIADLQNDNDNDNTQESLHSGDGDDLSPQSEHLGDKRKDRGDEPTPGAGSGNKRRESEEKSAKKPGRKPLTNEPTSKRKAQNRAAQRAFRERKEKHLRDLEQKVEDLEKASEATNHENGVLRAQVDRLNAEVAEYKKRLPGPRAASYSSAQPVNKINWDIGQNFDFEFPKFGIDNGAAQKTTECVHSMRGLNKLEKDSAERDFYRSSTTFNWSPSPHSSSRSVSTSTGVSNYFDSTQSHFNKVRSPTASTDKSLSTTESPVSLGLGSSVCTTPEATVDSPGQYKNDKKLSKSQSDFRGAASESMQEKQSANLIAASTSPSQPKTPGQDAVPSLDWFASQNSGLFDPILIDAYREPQDNILNNADLNLSFFDDAFPWNVSSNFSAPLSTAGPQDHGTQSKKSLIDQVESAAEGLQHDTFSHVEIKEAENISRQITCAKLWDRVQRSEKVLSGEADMDDLCSQLKAKARCGGPNKGAVVDERDVDAILGPDPNHKKTTGMYGMFS